MQEFTDEQFKKEKEDILSREDLSKIGRIDPEIEHIVDKINELPFWCTTSSCAGRITLLERRSSKKTDSTWLIASHQPVTVEQVKEKMSSDSDVWLMQESFILHVFCQGLKAAEEFLALCHLSGFKRSGITALKNKIMIEVMGNEKVEQIVMKDGKKLITDEQLPILVQACNERMKINREKMERFFNNIPDHK